MIVWLNGPFGAGKTTVSRVLQERRPSFVVFDTETVGFMLRPPMGDRLPVNDFQDWKAWRALVVASLIEIATELDADVLVPQTVLVQSYWAEIVDGLRGRDQEVRSFTLDVAHEEHARRIDGDLIESSARGWRHDRRRDYDEARDWLARESTFIDTTHSVPEEVADAILTSVA